MAGRDLAAALGAAALLAALLLCSAGVEARQVPPAPPTSLDKVLNRYFRNAELLEHMRDFARRCSSVAKLHQIGRSVRGFPLLVLEISDKPGVAEAEPNFKYIANMHGTEPGGRQLLLAFAEWLCANHQTDPRAKAIVSGMHMWLMPTMNPDGFASITYENANRVNLNRDFPDPINNPRLTPSGFEQPETKAVMNWTLSRQFTAAANLHEGNVVVNYPMDGSKSGEDEYSASQDDATFIHLAKTYAQLNPRIRASKEFIDGITNGADWYPVSGGMQDWNYVKAGCFEVTLELWRDKANAPLKTLWAENRDSLAAYALTSTLGGLRGTVKQADTGAPLAATITVNGSTTVTRNTKRFGDFYRPLAPGRYTARVTLAGRRRGVKSFPIVVPKNGTGVQLNVTF